MHFFGYRSCDPVVDGSAATGQTDALAARTHLDPSIPDPEAECGGSRLIFLNVKDEYRISWGPSQLPHSYELFVEGSEKKGTIEISRRRDGVLSLVARAFLPQDPSAISGLPRVDGANTVWAVRAREKARWEPSEDEQEVRIDLTRDSGLTWQPLFEEPPTGGAETWSITGPMAQNHRIRIRTIDRSSTS